MDVDLREPILTMTNGGRRCARASPGRALGLIDCAIVRVRVYAF